MLPRWMMTARTLCWIILAWLVAVGMTPQGTVSAFGLTTIATGTGEFGAALDVTGDLAIVGAPGSNTATIYRLNAGTWSLEATLTLPGGAGTERFGTAVAIEGTRALVTAPGYDPAGLTNAGRAYLFALSGGSWSLDVEIPAPIEADERQFGLAAAFSGSHLVIREAQGLRFFNLRAGTWELNSTFPVTIAHQVVMEGEWVVASQGVGMMLFRWSGSNWMNLGTSSQPNALPSGVALVGGRMALGYSSAQLGFNERAGAVGFSTRQPNGSWVSAPGAFHPQPQTDMRLGTTVAFSGNRLVTGRYSFRQITPDGWSLAETMPLPGDDLTPFTLGMVDVDEVLIGSPTTNSLYHYQFLPNADLTIQAEAEFDAVERGYSAPFAFTVVNRGPEAASNVTVQATLPTGITYVSGPAGCGAVSQVVTCTIGALDVADSATRSIVVLVAGNYNSTLIPLTFTADGDEIDPISANNSSTATMETLSQPGTPTLLTPAAGINLTSSRSPAFAWSGVGDLNALYYDLRFDIVNPPVIGYFIEGGTSFTPPETLMTTTYYWRVRAILYQGNIRGQWSETRSFTVNYPSAAPIRTVFNTNLPTLTWSPVTDANVYAVQVSLVPTFDPQWTFTLNDNTTIPGTQYTLTDDEFLGNGVYWWRVSALVQRGNSTIASPWSAADTFAIVNLGQPGLPPSPFVSVGQSMQDALVNAPLGQGVFWPRHWTP
jgi:uncharacterized repeat protein (TIGR01451 family)